MKQFTFLLIIGCLLFKIGAYSQIGKQGDINVSLGAEIMIPESAFSLTHLTGFAFIYKGEYVFHDHTSFTFSTGFYQFEGKKLTTIYNQNITGIPLKAGLRYYLGNFYGSVEGGSLVFLTKGRGSNILLSFGIGDEIKIGTKSIDFGINYELWKQTVDGQTFGFIGLRAAYEFHFVRSKKSTKSTF